MAEQGIIDDVPTITSKDQQKTERDVVRFFKSFLIGNEDIRLNRELHVGWCQRGLLQLPTNFAGLDASRPWFVFWISHSLEMLGAYDDILWAPKVASFIHHCEHAEGGVGGGPLQLAHLAPTYAATSAMIIAGGPAYSAIDRAKVYKFLMRMKDEGGGFKMHDEGEIDMRGTYCAVAVASMLHILTDDLMKGVADYVLRCQTWEGGIAGEEGLEAHGGYTYCGLAALCIIGQAHVLDLDALLNWAAHRQMTLEGGFQGRTNKLVDSCYSFWQGAIFPLVQEAFRQVGRWLPDGEWYAPKALQMYVLLACQHHGGGLRDKPNKSADFYHTCYALSGVAASQDTTVAGHASNKLDAIDVFYNVLREKSDRKVAFFESLPPLEVDGQTLSCGEGSGVIKARAHRLQT
uniref:Protein farnesyltransferase subunit beta n=1 Tax=Noctiluca scintillans TaxID=2966 RepID=A0A7S1F983_NOCSC|mmetsp:Transcript_41808/g.110692  ORF Transcript_41808/g.110692 Transcript_41808/m.110692 type:complete len:404 (+) Transcript_41808:45-1256(+)